MEHHHPIKEIEELLNKLTRKELVMVNRAVLKRVKLMDDLERLKSNAAFFPGDRVSWSDKQGYLRTGRVIRINTKTISIEEDGDPEGIWRVSAKLLTKTGTEHENEVEFTEADDVNIPDDVNIADEKEENHLGEEELARQFGIFPNAGHGHAPVPGQPKTGRNAPCPCGSGRKYKHCCWPSYE
jgi:hypothetical protein